MYIYLTKQNNFVSRVIRKVTNSNVSHVAIYHPEYHPLMLHATHSGLHFSHYLTFLKEHDVEYIFELKTEQEQRTLGCFRHALLYLETPYDFKAILGLLINYALSSFGFKNLRNRLGKRNAFFCSEALFFLFSLLIDRGLLPNILKGFHQEEFTPQNALQIMFEYPDYFVCHGKELI